jgi:hypothetical protein
MRRSIASAAIFILALVAAGPVVAQPFPSPQTIDHCRRATVFIVVGKGSAERSGTGFFISSHGLAVTSYELLRGGTEPLRVFLNSGLPDERRVRARPIIGAEAADVALIEVPVDEPTPFLALADTPPAQGERVWQLGFPPPVRAGPEPRGGPGLDMTEAQIVGYGTTPGRDLVAFKLRAPRPHRTESGGPVVSLDGKVIGMLPGPAHPNFPLVTSAWRIRTCLAGQVDDPTIEPTALPAAGGAVTVTAKVIDVLETPARVFARIEGPDLQRDVDLAPVGREWRATFSLPPAPDVAIGGPAASVIPVQLRMSDGRDASTHALGSEIGLAGAFGRLSIPLSEVRSITFGKQDVVETSLGSFTGALQGLTLDGVFPPSRLRSATLGRPPRSIYRVQVRAVFAKHAAESQPRILSVGGIPTPTAEAVAVTHPVARRPAEIVKVMPSAISDAKLGGAGRFVVVLFQGLRVLGLFDIESAQLVKQIPLLDEDVLFAPGRSKLLVCYPKRALLVRYDLQTFERELTVAVPLSGEARNLELGSHSDGPAYLRCTEPGGGYAVPEVALLDVARLQVLPIARPPSRDVMLLGPALQIRPSADGSVAAGWQGGGMNSGLVVLTASTENLSAKYAQQAPGYIVPSEDGSMFFTQVGPASSALTISGTRRRSVLPIVGTPLMLDFPAPRQGPEEVIATVVTRSERRRIVDLDFPLFERYPDEYMRLPEPSLDRRVFALPQVIVTIPFTNDRIVLHRLDLEAVLEKTGIDYLFVASTPPRVAQVGAEWTYPIAVRSKRGGVKMALETAPDGMTLEGGTLRWTPRSDAKPPTVIVRVADASGQELYHTIQLLVGK